jgi:RNA polymerase sigma-70 factor (ECF subfamily)
MIEIDKVTLEKFKTGDEKSFNIIYNAYYRLIKQIAFSYTKDNFESDNLVQETFTRLWINKDKVDSTNKNFKYYLTQITKNLCLDYINKLNQSKLIYLDEDILDNISNQNINDSKDDDYIDYYMSLIKDILDDESYEILILHYETGLKFKDIAKIKNTTTSTITSKASKAMKLLKERLKNEE